MSMLLSLSLWIIMGVASAYWAQIRGRDPVSWFVIGMLLGIFGLLILFLLPKLEIKPAPLEEAEIEVVKDIPFDNPRFKNWYYMDGTYTQQGPLTFLNLEKLFDQNLISPSTLVWCDGMNEWKEISTIVELKKESYASL